jgi:hypothetical protein
MFPDTKIKFPVRTNGKNAAADGGTGAKTIPRDFSLS